MERDLMKNTNISVWLDKTAEDLKYFLNSDIEGLGEDERDRYLLFMTCVLKLKEVFFNVAEKDNRSMKEVKENADSI